MAVWVTAMALAEISYKIRSFFHLLGFVGILIGTQFTLTGLWTFLVPLIIAAAILSISWVSFYFRKRCIVTAQLQVLVIVLYRNPTLIVLVHYTKPCSSARLTVME